MTEDVAMDYETNDRLQSLNSLLDDVKRTVLLCAIDQKVSRGREDDMARKLRSALSYVGKLGTFGNKE